MISRFLLIVSFLAIILLSIKLLRKTHGTSLLAWHALMFTVVFNPAVFFIQSINYEFPSTEAVFVAYYDQVIADRIILSLVLVNLILVSYLLILNHNVSRHPALGRPIFRVFGSVPIAFYIGIAIAIAGLVSYLNTPMAQIILESGPSTIGDYDAYYQVRYAVSQAGMPRMQQHFHNLSIYTILPLLTLYSLQRYLLERKTGWAMVWGTFLFMWMIISVLQLAKSFVTYVAMANFITVILVQTARPGGRRIRSAWVVVGALSVFVIINYVYQSLGAATGLAESALLLFERFVAIPVHTTWNHFVVFPDLYPHTHYATSQVLNLILAGGIAGGPRDMMPYHIASAILTGRAYNMNTSFLGSGWAEMGYLGVVESALLIFGVLLLWDRYLIRRATGIPVAALVAFFLGQIWHIHNNDLGFMLLSGGLIFGPVFYIMLFWRELQIKLSWSKRMPRTRKQHSGPSTPAVPQSLSTLPNSDSLRQ